MTATLPKKTPNKSDAGPCRERNAQVVAMVDHDHMTFKAIAEIHGITRQRAHQIYKRETSRIGVKAPLVDANREDQT